MLSVEDRRARQAPPATGITGGLAVPAENTWAVAAAKCERQFDVRCSHEQ